MNARQLDDAAGRLHELGVESAEDIVLAMVATGLALAASQLLPALAMPFLAGAIAVGFLGVRAYVRRTFLVEDLASEPDAYVIPAVRNCGLRATTVANRHALARTIRIAAVDQRLAPIRGELAQLPGLLEDNGRRLDPCSLVALEQWLRDPCGSFRDLEAPAADLRGRLHRFLAELEADS
jgi:hypothetical protein